MTKRKPALHVQADLSGVFNVQQPQPPRQTHKLTIHKALTSVLRQMRAAGLRERTMDDYELHVSHFAKVTGVQALEDVTSDHIYEWLSSMNVSNQTKLTRLKCLKAFLSRCLDNGWVTSNYWRGIRIKVDNPVKEGATDRDIRILLSLLDLSKFVELRDATAVLLMYQTGIRVGTLSKLQSKHIDLDAQMLKMDGGIIKNHQSLYVPFDNTLMTLLTVLIEQNDLVRQANRTNNDLLFITKNGTPVVTSQTGNNITKRLGRYAKEYGLKNINPHALRRGFAKNLLGKGANIALISKALGHSDLAVTTRYLHLDKEEVAENLRSYL
ncbi:tyrosine-type recombinase/integrase [Fictibacillus nanhaiensis]|uniref:tyrosine-type recombinase/integrase n=1 Tax=Fictibacillus nanhaiensis TaxID=742169 RepID=UPI00203F7C7C|nr:tyrosine-type recombinase/integrase [Fictibacillus nanhaiensis]